MSLRRNRSIAWIAAFAVLLQALWPLLSHARPNDLSLPITLCSVNGVTHSLEIKVGKTTPLDKRAASHGEHCKLCVFGDGKGVALVVVDLSPFAPEIQSSRNSGTPQAFFPQEALNSARPRAPPAAS
jgi:hypothetical protein